MPSSSVRDRLIVFLAGKLPGREVDDGTLLLTSGLLDSLALIDLMAWMEDEIGAAIDLDAIANPATEWNTVSDILSFIAARNGKVPH